MQKVFIYGNFLCTSNYTINDPVNKTADCMLFNESIAGKGGNEMASCLYKWALLNLTTEIEELLIWSDNCTGQNKNMPMIAFYNFLFEKFPNLKRITHKYLLRGDTHLEVDGVHSIIERGKKKMPNFSIFLPSHWGDMIQKCKFEDPLGVIYMTSADFLNFKKLFDKKLNEFAPLKHLAKTKKFPGLLKVCQFQLRRSEPNVLYYKTECNGEFDQVNIKRRNLFKVSDVIIEPIREGAKPINRAKYNDLQELKQWIPEEYHKFYDNLTVTDKAIDSDDEN